MDAIGMLEQEHKNVKLIMEEIAKSAGSQKKKLFETLKHALEAHDHLEEVIFYPSVLLSPKTEGLLKQDKKAHEVVEKALDQLASLPLESSDWTPIFNAMKERLLKHVSDEESNFFIKIREVLSATELVELGDKMKAETQRQLTAV